MRKRQREERNKNIRVQRKINGNVPTYINAGKCEE